MSRKVFTIDSKQYEYYELRNKYSNVSFPSYENIKQSDLPSEVTLTVLEDTVKELTIDDRVWTCVCGEVINRDENAAINILNVGLNMV